jgi:hypothetical protein
VKLSEKKEVHYREIHKEIRVGNFQLGTKVDFKEIVPSKEHKSILETWGRFKHINKDRIIYEHTSKSGSQYVITEDKLVYRLADHWGGVSSCLWTLDGKGNPRNWVYETGPLQMGVARLEDFEIFIGKNTPRTCFVTNPMWKTEIKKVEPIKKKLGKLKANPEFKALPSEDKQLIGWHWGFFNKALKTA